MRRALLSAAFFAVGNALMGRNPHDPFQTAVGRADGFIAQLEVPLESHINNRLQELFRNGGTNNQDFVDYMMAKSQIDQQWYERKQRYAAKARLYVRAQEKFFVKKERKVRKEAEAAGLTAADEEDKRLRMQEALRSESLGTDKFLVFVDHLTKGLLSWVKETDQEDLHKKIMDVLELNTVAKNGKKEKAAKKGKKTKGPLKKFFQFVSLAIATEYVVARGVIFDPSSNDEVGRWEHFMDAVRWTLASVPVEGPKERNGGNMFKLNLQKKLHFRAKLRLHGDSQPKEVDPNSFLMKMIERFQAAHDHNNWNEQMGPMIAGIGPGTVVAYFLRSGNIADSRAGFENEVQNLIDTIKDTKQEGNVVPLTAMQETLKYALQNADGLHEYQRAWAQLDGNPRYYAPGVLAQASRELEAYNAIDDYFLMFEQPRGCGRVTKNSKTAHKDCQAYLRAIHGFKAAEVDRLDHRMQRVHAMVDMVSQYDKNVPVEDPQNPGHALSPVTVRQLPMFQEFLMGLTPSDADVKAKEIRDMREQIKKHMDAEKLDSIPNAKGRTVYAEDFAKDLLRCGFNKHEAKKLFDNFKQAGDAPGMKLWDQKVEEIKREIEEQEQIFEAKLDEMMRINKWSENDNAYKEQKQQFLIRLEQLSDELVNPMQQASRYNNYGGKSTNWMGQLWDVVTAWKERITKPQVMQNTGVIKAATNLRPDQLIFYPEVKKVLDARLNLGKASLDEEGGMRLLTMALAWGYNKETLEYLFGKIGKHENIDDLFQALLDYRIINEVSLVDVRSWDRYLQHGYNSLGKDDQVHMVKKLKPKQYVWNSMGGPRTDASFEMALYCAKLWGHLPRRKFNVVEQFRDLVGELAKFTVFVKPKEGDAKKAAPFYLINGENGNGNEWHSFLMPWLRAEANPSADVAMDRPEECKSGTIVGNEIKVAALKIGWNPNP